MPRLIVVSLALAFAFAFGGACSGHSPGGGGGVDAAKNDAKVFMDAAGSNLAHCMGSAYDPCTIGGSTCMSGTNCHNFMAAGITVCAPSCSASMPCPNQGSTMITCQTNMGICKPPMANACTP